MLPNQTHTGSITPYEFPSGPQLLLAHPCGPVARGGTKLKVEMEEGIDSGGNAMDNLSPTLSWQVLTGWRYVNAAANVHPHTVRGKLQYFPAHDKGPHVFPHHFSAYLNASPPWLSECFSHCSKVSQSSSLSRCAAETVPTERGAAARLSRPASNNWHTRVGGASLPLRLPSPPISPPHLLSAHPPEEGSPLTFGKSQVSRVRKI